MQTTTHLIIAAAAFAKPGQPKVTVAALLGGFIPDLSLYLLFIWHRFVLGTSTIDIFDRLYFSDTWQMIFAVDNSFFLWGAALGLGLWLKNNWLLAFSGAGLLHLICDFLLHHDDARAQFWPLTLWKFQSPVSYYDRNYHGAVFSVLEILLVVVLLTMLWRRFTTPFPRSLIAGAALLTVAPFLIFRVIMQLG